MRASKLYVSLRHLDVGMAEYLRQLVKDRRRSSCTRTQSVSQSVEAELGKSPLKNEGIVSSDDGTLVIQSFIESGAPVSLSPQNVEGFAGADACETDMLASCISLA